MEIGVVKINREMVWAMEAGLRKQFGEPLGSLLADAVSFGSHGLFDLNKVRHNLSDEAAAIVAGIVANRADAPMMLMLRNQMIGHAILHDRDGVVRWATEGLNRCKRVNGPWLETIPQWQWVLDNTDRYILYVRQLKLFLNQL